MYIMYYSYYILKLIFSPFKIILFTKNIINKKTFLKFENVFWFFKLSEACQNMLDLLTTNWWGSFLHHHWIWAGEEDWMSGGWDCSSSWDKYTFTTPVPAPHKYWRKNKQELLLSLSLLSYDIRVLVNTQRLN